jgi:threonine aldolase
MDGARFANALTALNCTPAEMTWKSGIDVLSFGATKNGCLAAEAIIFFNKDLVGNIAFLMKRAGHLLYGILQARQPSCAIHWHQASVSQAPLPSDPSAQPMD